MLVDLFFEHVAEFVPGASWIFICITGMILVFAEVLKPRVK